MFRQHLTKEKAELTRAEEIIRREQQVICNHTIYKWNATHCWLTGMYQCARKLELTYNVTVCVATLFRYIYIYI